MLHVFNISGDEKTKRDAYVISTHSKMAPIPMLMFSAVMYLVCTSGSGKAMRTERSGTHVLDETERDKDRKSRSLPERQEHCDHLLTIDP